MNMIYIVFPIIDIYIKRNIYKTYLANIPKLTFDPPKWLHRKKK